MSLKRLPSVLHRHSLKRGPLRGRAPLDESRQREGFEREVQKARELALEIGWSLRRSEERLDSALQRTDSTLQELAAQRERIQRLEHDLGIER
jgi:hypothetical protein